MNDDETRRAIDAPTTDDHEPDPPLDPGTIVGEHRIVRRVGSGTFGDVYAAEHTVLGKRVAIKLLRRKLSANDEAVARFIAEARAVSRMRHRNLVDVFGFGSFEGERRYYVMDLFEGETLGALLDRETCLDPARVVPILEGIAAALDASHAAGVVHRDLKPENVFLAREPDGSVVPKVLDFGIAKLLGDDMGPRTATGILLGTPRYMSPEQCRGRPVDHRADIYALGVLAHEMLTGAPPFANEALVDLLLQHTIETPPRVSAARPGLSPALDAPVLAMLAKRPADRPASAGQAIAALAVAMKPRSATLPLGSMIGSAPTMLAPATSARPMPAAIVLPAPPLQRTALLDPPAAPIGPTKLSPGRPPAARVDVAPTSIPDSIPSPPTHGNAPVIAVLAALLIGVAALVIGLGRRGDRVPAASTSATPIAVAPTIAPSSTALTVTPSFTASAAAATAVPSPITTAPPAISSVPADIASSAKPSPSTRPTTARSSAVKPADAKGRDIGF
ncbi:serine/threonine protein kinase [Minicystis rosea]|nr:serine/threonine protein kinase [Minicystis rosea]